VIHADRFVNVPHFAVKSGAERMIEQMGFSATILRPSYFIDNEHMIKDVIFNHGVYPMPIGSKGVAMVDARDIAEVAAIELIRREQAPGKLPVETINLVGPDTLTGSDVAAIWSDVLGRPVAYGGDDPTGFEQNLAKFMPKWMAYEMRLMAERYVSDGMIPEVGDVDRRSRSLAARCTPIATSRPRLQPRPDSRTTQRAIARVRAAIPGTAPLHIASLARTTLLAAPITPAETLPAYCAPPCYDFAIIPSGVSLHVRRDRRKSAHPDRRRDRSAIAGLDAGLSPAAG
jgi:hypothetical protein